MLVFGEKFTYPFHFWWGRLWSESAPPDTQGYAAVAVALVGVGGQVLIYFGVNCGFIALQSSRSNTFTLLNSPGCSAADLCLSPVKYLAREHRSHYPIFYVCVPRILFQDALILQNFGQESIGEANLGASWIVHGFAGAFTVSPKKGIAFAANITSLCVGKRNERALLSM